MTDGCVRGGSVTDRTKCRTAMGNAPGKMRTATTGDMWRRASGEMRPAPAANMTAAAAKMSAAATSRMSATTAGMAAATSLGGSRRSTHDHAQGKAYCRCTSCYFGHVENPPPASEPTWNCDLRSSWRETVMLQCKHSQLHTLV